MLCFRCDVMLKQKDFYYENLSFSISDSGADTA